MKNPKISVIMPVYNAEKFLEEAIKSILNQTYENWELIIINDASKDRSLKIINNYAKIDERIIIINNGKNVGCYVSRNYGIDKSSGDYITFVDSDDHIHKNKIKLQVNYLNNNKNILVVFCYVKSEGIINKCITASLIRKEVFNKIGYFDSVRIAADTEFRIRFNLIFGSRKRSLIPKILYYAQIRPTSLSRSSQTHMYSLCRLQYKENFNKWHHKNKYNKKNLYMPFPLGERLFPAPKKILP